MENDLGEGRNYKFNQYNAKYLHEHLDSQKLLSNDVDSLGQALENLLLNSTTSSTWKKHNSAWNSYKSFCNYTKSTFELPISMEKIRAYVTWAITVNKLKFSTVESYLSSISTAHHLAGKNCENFMKDRCVQLLLKGAENVRLLENPSCNTRLAMNIHLLKLFSHNISSTHWDTLSKQVIWTAGAISFYTSCRMGEIVSVNKKYFDPKTTVTWDNVIFLDEKEAIIHVPYSKSTGLKGIVLNVFPTNCITCPYAALRTLETISKETGVYERKDPIFKFKSGNFLTVQTMNNVIENLLSQFTDEKNTLSCHSFRAAIPSAIAAHPNKVTVAEVKEWGQWHSDSYKKYTRQERDKNREMFYKTISLLH